jgi:hypothetical protein
VTAARECATVVTGAEMQMLHLKLPNLPTGDLRMPVNFR